MQASTQLKSLVDRMPDPDDRGMYTKNIEDEKIRGAVEEIHRGGRENVLGLIAMLVPPGEGDDVKAHYALHCLAVHVTALDDDRARREFSEAVASQLGSGPPKAVQRYLCRVLQTAGGREAVGGLGELLGDEELCEPAAQALAAIGEGAAEQFRRALSSTAGKCRLTVVQNLGVVGGAEAAEALRKAVDDGDREIRLAAAWALANIGDPGAVDVLLAAAEVKDVWERDQATNACFLLAERLLGAGRRDEAVRIYRHVHDTRTGADDRHHRAAAAKGLLAARG